GGGGPRRMWQRWSMKVAAVLDDGGGACFVADM
nr:hypothetical protein [Tanacetum cinerariifolium]